jgi:sialic acid synthase SpsE
MAIEFFAEIGSNFITDKGPDVHRAFKLIETAAEMGCTGVKFQYYKANDLWHPAMVKELEVAEQRELPLLWIPELYKCAKENRLLFGLSVFDESAVEEVKDYVDYFKIASFEISKFDLIEKCYSTGKRLMLSIGQSDKDEIAIILSKLPENGISPAIDILHCVSKYPAAIHECNLSIIKDNPWINGWSDHTDNAVVIQTAIVCGAKVIEFHLDLDDMKGVESTHSWNPYDMCNCILDAEEIELSLGVSSWDIIKANQDRKYKADPVTGLRGNV